MRNTLALFPMLVSAAILSAAQSVNAAAPSYPTAALDALATELSAQVPSQTDPATRARLGRIVAAARRVRLASLVDATGRIFCQGSVFTITSLVIERDTILSCDKVVFAHGATLTVKNGATFVVDALTIEDGGDASIIAVGVNGARGGSGQAKGDPWSSRGDGDYWRAVNDCKANGAHPDRGGSGGRGSDGGDGGIVFFAVAPLLITDAGKPISVDYRGGSGGPGGPGGAGRLLKNGRNNYCDGCMYNCPSGSEGSPGNPGTAGGYFILQ